MLVIDIYTVLIWLSAVIVGSFGVVIFVGSKNLSSRLFLFTLISIFIWMIVLSLVRIPATVLTVNFFARLSYLMGMVISATFLYFCLSFPQNKLPSFWIGVLLAVILSGYIPLFFFTDLIIRDPYYIGGTAGWGWHYGPLWFLFDIFFNAAFLTGLVVLYRKYRKTSDLVEKKNIKFMFWAVAIAVIPASVTGIIMPRFGYFDLTWLAPISILGWVSLVSYSIARYRQMDVRALSVEVFVLVMVVVLFANVFFGETFGFPGRIGTLLSFLLIAYFVIRGIIRETNLNDYLKEKVNEQTKKIRKAYEVEKEARIDLEHLNEEKDRFLLATQHNLRTPLTVVKGFIDVALEEEKESRTRAHLNKAADATNQMVSLLNNVLEVTETRVQRKGQ